MNIHDYHPSPLATVDRTYADGRWTLTFTRGLRHPIESVWSAISTPEQLRQWAPYTVDRDLANTGDVTVVMLGDDDGPDEKLPGVVLRSEPPRLLEHAWGPDVLRWELTPTEGGTILTLHHTFDDEQMASALGAGWHLCLDVADSVLSGTPFGPARGSKAREYGWDELNEEYAAVLGMQPSEVAKPDQPSD